MINRLLVLLCLAIVFPPSCGGGGTDGVSTVLVASGSVGAAGGTVAVTDPLSPAFGTQVVIPAAALAANTDITIRLITSGGPYDSEVLTCEFGPAGTLFLNPVTVTLKYKQTYLDDHGVTDETILRIQQTSTGLPDQVLTTGGQDTANDTISGDTTHFSKFAALLYTKATLQGDYHFQTFAYDHLAAQSLAQNTGTPLPAPLGYFTNWGTINFDGVGGYSLPAVFEKYDQTLTGPFAGPVGTYTVDHKGAVVLSGGANVAGNVLAGGNVLIFRVTVANADVQFGVAVKEGTGFTNASLTGTYHFAAFAYDNNPAQPNAPLPGMPLPTTWPQGTFTNFGVLSFDGAGAVSGTAIGEKYDNLVTGPTAGPLGTYAMAADGSFTFGGGLSGSGALSIGGDVLIFRETAGAAPRQIGVAIRKAGALTNAALKGSYAFQTMSYDLGETQGTTPALGNVMPVAKGFFCDFATLTLDGLGAGSISGKEKIDQLIISFNNLPGTYNVAADGTLTLTNFGGPGAVGGVLLGGGVFISWDQTAGNVVQIGMALRK